MMPLLQRWLSRCNQREIEAQGWILKLVFMFLSNNALSIEWGYGDIAQSVGTSQPHPQNGTRDRIRIPGSGKRLGWRKKNILAGWPCLARGARVMVQRSQANSSHFSGSLWPSLLQISHELVSSTSFYHPHVQRFCISTCYKKFTSLQQGRNSTLVGKRSFQFKLK